MAGNSSKHNVTSPAHDYAAQCSYRPNPVLEKLQKYTRENIRASMMLGDTQCHQLMADLARAIGTKKALDVGVYTGSSALVIAQVLPDDGKLVAMDVSEDWTSVGRRFWEEAGVAHKIDLRIAPAMESLNSLIAAGEAGSYDFAFIDADKDNYTNYYELCLQLVRPGGIIAVDNTLWDGRAYDDKDNDPSTKYIRECNDAIRKDPRVSPCMLVMGDGLTLVFKL